MNWVALRMLMGDKAKYMGIVFGVNFAALLMAQQSAIFAGLMRNTTSQVQDLEGADIWVMDKSVQSGSDRTSSGSPSRAATPTPSSHSRSSASNRT